MMSSLIILPGDLSQQIMNLKRIKTNGRTLRNCCGLMKFRNPKPRGSARVMNLLHMWHPTVKHTQIGELVHNLGVEREQNNDIRSTSHPRHKALLLWLLAKLDLGRGSHRRDIEELIAEPGLSLIQHRWRPPVLHPAVSHHCCHVIFLLLLCCPPQIFRKL